VKTAAVWDRIFWDSYATAYDDIARYYKPYKGLIRETARVLKNGLRGGRILDAGCGTGEMSRVLAGIGYEMTGIDISENMLKVFRKKLSVSNHGSISASRGDLNRKLPFENHSFSALVNIHSLFMLPDKLFTLGEFLRVVKPGGLIVIAHHKPVDVIVIVKAVLKAEGLLEGLFSIARLLRVGFFNAIAGVIHRKAYGHFKTDKIICFMKNKRARLLLSKKMYNGFDDFLVFKKSRSKNGCIQHKRACHGARSLVPGGNPAASGFQE
jgi:ubiquinone/menaquinone biosynthesis C-methylase UbiE